MALRRIEAAARRRPDAPALRDGSRGLSAGELDRLAAVFAAALAERGAAPEVPVAIAVADPIARTVACLAAWKSGAAYVPLDPEAPPARLSFVVADCGAPLVVSDGGAEGFAGAAAVVPIDVDALGVQRPVPVPSLPDDPQRLAYVIYTSGSTGEPKGVAVEHGSLARLIAWHGRAFGIGPGDRASGLANPAFDAAVWELWGALGHGAAVHFAPAVMRADAARLRDWIVAEEITIAFAPTPVAERLIALPWPEETRLRRLLTGGDALRSRPRAGLPFRLVNNYGPTENTVVATSGVVDPGEDGQRPSIGRAIDGVEARILDGNRECGDGEAGELCLSGALLARGYVGGAGRLSGGFATHPFRPGARIYRTGDRVRRRTDGEIEFLGRVDDQVKIRGFRIEP
ncbi:MAG TPA: amino acid adenylation domain-containing protein, partial [Thermoanaerobaculia bacterium]|nr:amino acid adenylation domain-containing protein [Thermoanaerobaculia bacterium]